MNAQVDHPPKSQISSWHPENVLQEFLGVTIFRPRNCNLAESPSFRLGEVAYQINDGPRSYGTPTDPSSEATLGNSIYIKLGDDVEYHCKESLREGYQVANLESIFSIDIAFYPQCGDRTTAPQSFQACYRNSKLLLFAQGTQVFLKPDIGVLLGKTPVVGKLFVVELHHRADQEVLSYMAYSITMGKLKDGSSLISLSSDWHNVWDIIGCLKLRKQSAPS